MKNTKETKLLALDTEAMTTREIADAIGAHHGYVRLLLAKHRLKARPDGITNDPKFIALVREKAEQGLNITDAARDLGVSLGAMYKIRNRHGIRFGRKLRVCKSGAPSKIVAVFAALFHNPERDNVKIGRELGVSREYVSQIRMAMREHGITKILNADSQAESKKL